MKAAMSLATAVVVTVATTMAAYAQGPGSSARWSSRAGGPVQVDAGYFAPDGCQAILSVGGGAPAGVSVYWEIIPVTVVIGPNPYGCTGEVVHRRVFSVGGAQHHNLVQLFFVSYDGKPLRTEKVAIQTR